MLQIELPEDEMFNENDNTFVPVKKEFLQLEHSLVSLSKWESKWHVPFLGKEPHTDAQMKDYIRCMTITQNVKPEVYLRLKSEHYKEIEEYIGASMTATWFSNRQNLRNNREIITAEIIYYWMIANNIPMECQKWHLDRLMTLIRVCNIKNTPPKKQNRREMLNDRAALNRARREQLNTRG